MRNHGRRSRVTGGGHAVFFSACWRTPPRSGSRRVRVPHPWMKRWGERLRSDAGRWLERSSPPQFRWPLVVAPSSTLPALEPVGAQGAAFSLPRRRFRALLAEDLGCLLEGRPDIRRLFEVIGIGAMPNG